MTDTTYAILPDRAVVRAHGADAYDLLQRLVTGNTDRVAAGEPVYALLLTPQGKFLFDFFMVADPEHADAILLDCAAARADALRQRLTMYTLRADAAFEDVRKDYAVIAHWGPGARVLPDALSFADPRSPLLGVRSLVPADGVSAFTAQAAGAAGESDAYRAFTVALGVPDGAVDIRPDKDFPIESNLDLLHGIDFQKGCFVGQEVASRAHRKGKARKRLVVADIDGTPPEAASDVVMGSAKIGTIAGSTPSHALAMVFLDRVAKAGGVHAQAGGAQLTLRVPPYADFALEGASA